MPQQSIPDVPELNVDSCDVELAWEAAAAAAIAEKKDERFLVHYPFQFEILVWVQNIES